MAAFTQKNQVSIFLIFLTFGIAYLFSSLLRGVTATLAPLFVHEFSLSANELGLLGGAYFLGFAVMQLPMGSWLDRYGTKRVLAFSLIAAVMGSYLFGAADSLPELLIARFLCGMGVSACLIAPLTAARLWLEPSEQQRVNLWMLMAGALGLLVATLPSQSAAVAYGWRAIFTLVAALFALTIAAILLWSPKTETAAAPRISWFRSYGEVLTNSYTWKIGPVGFFNYATLVAVQTLWVGPWLTDVAGYSSDEAATGLFWINLVMLFVFMFLGVITPKIVKSKSGAEGILKLTLPLSLLALFLIAFLGNLATWPYFSAYCIASSALALTHPAVGQHFESHQAGRAIAFFNLLLFLGVFAAQWGVGLIIAVINRETLNVITGYQVAFYILSLLSTLSYLWFVFFEKITHRES
ncbi:MAG: MFS transporter [Rhodocyclaceae bacterium]|nr:MFS transporter [Rhodocyclaceae bacterium]